jgi:signal transduction histidine kinase
VLRGLLASLVIGLAVAAAWLLPPDPIYAQAAQVADLATYPALLAAAALLYVYFRVTPGEDAAWLAVAAVFGTAQGVAYSAMRVVMEDEVRARPAWMLVSQVAVALILVPLLAASGRLRTPMDPIVLGLSLALVVSGARLVLVHRVEPPALLHDLQPALFAAVLLLYGVIGVLLVRRVPIPTSAGWRLAAVVSLLGLAHVLTYPLPPDDWRSLLAVALDVTGATLLAVTSLQLVRTAMARTDRAEEQVRALEALVREDQTLLHEVAGTLAGISAASQLLSEPTRLAPAERHHLEELLASETARVDRLLAGSRVGAPSDDIVDVDLDALIEPLVFAHGIRGRIVAWHPTGHHVWAGRDQLVEVLDLLLDNAARHAQSPIFSVTVERQGSEVDVAVEDQGPGIPPEIAASVLEWGTHGAGSSGQGIGLNVAQRLVTGMGGRLRIESDGDSGTHVVVTLSVAEVARADQSA